MLAIRSLLSRIILLGAAVWVAPLPTLAAGLVPCGGPAPEEPCQFKDLFQLLVNIFNFLLGFAALIAMALIIIAGIRMLLYYWSENPEGELTNAKNVLRRAIFGLGIVLSSYLIINTVLTLLGCGNTENIFNGKFLTGADICS